MNNEEKIIQILEIMQQDIKDLKYGQTNLEEGQAELTIGFAGLKAGQARIEAKQTKMEKDIKAIKKDVKDIKKELTFVWGDIKKIDNRLIKQEKETLFFKEKVL